MTNEIQKQESIDQNQEDEDKLKTAFLQVPVHLKEQMQAYLEELCAGSDLEFKEDATPFSSLPSQGCFLVISLEKIEQIVNGLKECLSMEPDNNAQNIKSQISQVLTLLS